MLEKNRKFQRTPKKSVPTAAYKNLFKEIVQQQTRNKLNLNESAVDALIESSEDFSRAFFQCANVAAIHCGRKTVMSKDFELVRYILNAFGSNLLK
uniref:Core Histone H2A/H2B/H3 domain-containing protein n=1 Tax=Meloidogyne enterolobii TaxID=390850 RepID=A0A6V7VJN8_MELEN|nr:unnamed protein product [Meloidogyne enterolobii]